MNVNVKPNDIYKIYVQFGDETLFKTQTFAWYKSFAAVCI